MVRECRVFKVDLVEWRVVRWSAEEMRGQYRQAAGTMRKK